VRGNCWGPTHWWTLQVKHWGSGPLRPLRRWRLWSPKFHCVKQLGLHLNLAYCSQSTPLSPCNHKISADLIEGTRGVSSGVPLRLGTLSWMWKKCTDIYCEKMLKFENFWKCTPGMYLFRFLNTPLGGGGGGNTDVCPRGRQIPSRRHRG